MADDSPAKRPLSKPPSIERMLSGYVDELSQRRERFHKERVARLGARAQESWQLLRQAAEAMIRGAGELASEQSVPSLRRLLRESAERCCHKHRQNLVNLLDEEVALWLGRMMCNLMPQASARLWNLLPLTESVQPHWRAAAFLKRVSRCYIFGFDAECVVMCRGVLEGAFEAAISDSECRKVVGARPWSGHTGHSMYDLHTRIAVAVRLGRVSEAVADDAETVRDAARKVVHQKPRVPRDPLPLIAKTIAVVRELSPKAQEATSNGHGAAKP